MIPNKKIDEYTCYCITLEGREFLRKMLEEELSPEEESDDELNMDEEIDFEHLKMFHEDDDDPLLNNDDPENQENYDGHGEWKW